MAPLLAERTPGAVYTLAKRSFPDFLRYTTIEDAHRGLIPFAPWPHLVERAEAWQAGDSEVVLKGRQLGLSWLAASYAAWTAMYKPGSLVLLISAGQREAYELLAKVRTVITGHRFAMGLDTAAMGELAVSGGGRCIALPSTDSAGRGYTATLVIADEAAFHPYAERNYAAYRPAMADGGQLLVLSTANGAAGWFHDIYWAADAGTVPLHAVFIPWDARPGRDAAWLVREQAAYSGLPAQFRAEYPRSAGEAFVAHSGLVYGLDGLTGQPIFSPELHVRVAPFTWESCKWRVAAIDPGGRDPTAIIVLGVSQDERLHVFGEFNRRGPCGADAMTDYLNPIHSRAPFDLLFYDPSQESLGASLRERQWPAAKASNNKLDGIGAVTMLLKARRLTFEPATTPSLQAEFSTYWWAERKDMMLGGSPSETRAPGGPNGHHADALDALRYAVLGILKGLPRGPQRIQMDYARAVRKGEMTWKQRIAERHEARGTSRRR